MDPIFQAAIDHIEAEIAALKANYGSGATPAPAPLPASSYAFDSAGMLTSPAPASFNGARIEAIVGADCPHTVKVASGHVLCLPRPDLKEGYLSYALRVSDQCGAVGPYGDRNGYLALLLLMPQPADASGWPEAADLLWHGQATKVAGGLSAGRVADAGSTAPEPAPGPTEVPIG